MKILMMTNTYKPIVGGLEKSVETFSKEFRKKGHRAVIVTPEYENAEEEKDVIRVPAFRYSKDANFSVQLPIPGTLMQKLGDFRPDIVHAHHPFLVGGAGLRTAYKYNVPLVFTHHTLYEQNTHYLSNIEALKRFVVELSTGYANLADQVFAPSESVMKILRQRGVRTPIAVVPTGIHVRRFARGNPEKIKNILGIPPDAYLVGHIGRLALEKNLKFLARAVAAFLKKRSRAHFLLVGEGPAEEEVKAVFKKEGLESRLHLAGCLKGQKLIDAYHAIDVFAFTSQSETQGLVLTEAMAAGVPIVAVDAPGVREVVKDKVNGRMIPSQSLGDFVSALGWMMARKTPELEKIRRACRNTAGDFSAQKSAERALEVYASLKSKNFIRRDSEKDELWQRMTRMIKAQWDITKNMAKGAEAMITGEPRKKSKKTKGRLTEILLL